MHDMKALDIQNGEEITGYRVKIASKPSFQITGYTIVIPPNDQTAMTSRFVRDVSSDGRLDSLKKASSVPAYIVWLGSWDSECKPGGMRYTACIEETDHTDFSCLLPGYPQHTQRFEACDWMCFEIPQERFDTGQFWKDDPYRMLRVLGYRFHVRVGVHFDAAPPDHDEMKEPCREFWISVAKQTVECDVCPVREECAKIQHFM